MGLEKSSAADPFIQISEFADVSDSLCSQKQSRKSWRFTVSAGAAIATAVFLVNVILLAWAMTSTQRNGDVLTLFEGSCETTRATTLWVHLAINLLSTLLLGASNNCAQLLTSPTREEVDKAHISGKWLDIGVPTVRNIPYISGKRVLIWALLVATSTPLHLLYNSAVYSSSTANAYQIALVTEDFLEGAWWNKTRVAENMSWRDQRYLAVQEWEIHPQPWITHPHLPVHATQDMQDNVTKLTKLDNAACIKHYTTRFQSEYGNVLVVTSSKKRDSVIQIWDRNPATYNWGPNITHNEPLWVCDGQAIDHKSPVACDLPNVIENAAGWTIHNVDQCQFIKEDHDLFVRDPDCQKFDTKIEYCLAVPTPGHCKIRLNIVIISIVIGCNLIKLACLIFTALVKKFEPLATTGDALASFIRHPVDSVIRDDKAAPEVWGCQYRQRRSRWISEMSKTRAILCFFVCIAIWCGGLASLLATFVIHRWRLIENRGAHVRKTFFVWPTWSQIWSLGFGTLQLSYTIKKEEHIGSVRNTLLANSPQLAASIVYVFFNNALTCMVSAQEYSKFASARKALRVTQPDGQQRSTIWLQLPYRYAVPLQSSMTLLHWLISRSLFMFQLTIYNGTGMYRVHESVWDRSGWRPKGHRHSARKFMSLLCCEFSQAPIVCALILGGLIILTLVALSLRRLDKGTPMSGSNSLALAAAAYPACDELNAAVLPLQFGVVRERGDPMALPTAGFSSEKVDPLFDDSSPSRHRFETLRSRSLSLCSTRRPLKR